ncbi:hypothetical protein EN885_14090 [Mesorhizobium sp. M6A.T.Cr.TU.014.01.1.1]|nr:MULTISPECIES: ABC-three component system middle component 5 [unclassified Mesorhizobium]RVB77269.1 hypothetical protein EN885_14090 [Mesorhizobium sp. M6A.T.Cr.TU.014.01.1.1]RWP73698.1 MAG: hypothetical protein EOR10_23785 [Mesorhizobium sp.]RWQ05189.1 MAG: hypothetical protein EOR90_14710 [Mesorhizobium sp.]RWQ10353.1 MAG: hypothetical protein EOR91_06500 [Mesorhizobium sp.]
MLSPFLIKDIRLSPKLQKYRKISERYDHLKPYGDQLESGLLFQRMEPIQKAAVQTLAARSLLDTDALKRLNEVRPLGDKIPSEIAKRAAEANEQQSDLMDFLATLTSEYPLAGENGLKARTRLMEHRYDAV